jgi:hypothetical protein
MLPQQSPIVFKLTFYAQLFYNIYRDGFLMLVAPIICNMSIRPITIFVRNSQPPTKARSFSVCGEGPLPTDSSNQGIALEENSLLFDIRFKLDAHFRPKICDRDNVNSLSPTILPPGPQHRFIFENTSKDYREGKLIDDNGLENNTYEKEDYQVTTDETFAVLTPPSDLVQACLDTEE